MPRIILRRIWRRAFFSSNRSYTSLLWKVVFLALLIGAYLGSGAFLSSFFLDLKAGDALWWAWSHLIDPGFISEDQFPLSRRILGSLYAVLGLAIIAGAVLGVVEEIARRSLNAALKGHLPRKLNDYTVVFGPAERLGSFVRTSGTSATEENDSDLVLVVPSTEDVVRIREKCGPNVFVVSAAGFGVNVRRLRMREARRLILLNSPETGPGEMLSFLVNLASSKAFRNPSKLDIYLEVETDAQASVLRQAMPFMNVRKENISVHIVNSLESSVRLALRNFPLDSRRLEHEKSGQVALVIYGWSDFSEELLSYVLRVAYFPSRPLRVAIVGEGRAKAKECLQSLGPAFSDKNNSYLGTILEISFPDSLYQLPDSVFEVGDSTTLAVCGDDPDLVMARTMDVQEHSHYHFSQIYVELPDNSGYRQALEQLIIQRGRLVPVGVRNEVFDLIEWLDAPARMLHDRYLAQREERGERAKTAEGRYVSKSDFDWEDLDEVRRDWNRASADHVEVKLRALADFYNLPRVFSRDSTGKLSLPEELGKRVSDILDHVNSSPRELREDLELLAMIEHDRWSGEKFVEGWTYGDEKDEINKRSPYLVDYQDLPEDIQRYDREAVVEALKYFVQN